MQQNSPEAWPEIPGVELQAELGRGGMAVVYRGIQTRLKRQVAVKVLSPVLLVDPQFSTRFLREAETAAGLNHSNIVSIYDVGSHGQWNYMVMEYLPRCLAAEISSGPLEPERALMVFKSIAAALAYAHLEGIVHRDVKPDNILFRVDGTPVLCDFGIAKAVGSATRLTKTGMSVGTPYYMSPEQARGRKVDGRSDLYSLGVVLRNAYRENYHLKRRIQWPWLSHTFRIRYRGCRVNWYIINPCWTNSWLRIPINGLLT